MHHTDGDADMSDICTLIMMEELDACLSMRDCLAEQLALAFPITSVVVHAAVEMSYVCLRL